MEYGKQLGWLRAAASDAGRDPHDIKPALIRFIVTGKSRDEVDEVIDSDIAKVFALNCTAEAWLIDEQTALSYAEPRQERGDDGAVHHGGSSAEAVVIAYTDRIVADAVPGAP